MVKPTTSEFEDEIRRTMKQEEHRGNPYVDIRDGDVHRRLGGYPGTNHAMPACCDAMDKLRGPRDEVLHRPPKGRGATLLIRYALPR